MIGFIVLLIEVLVALLVGYTVWWYFGRHPKNFPKGPWGVPLFGYLPFVMSGNGGIKFMEHAKKYGPIIGFDNGPALSIVLNDYNLIKKTFQDDNYAGKAPFAGETFLGTEQSFVVQDGQKWHEGRRFALTTLRNFGMGKSSMEPKILDEITHLLAYFKDQKEQPFEILELMALSVSNVGTLMQFSKRFDYDDKERLEVREEANAIFQTLTLFMMAPFLFPQVIKWGWHTYLPGYSVQKKCIDKIEKIMAPIIEEHKKNHYPGKCDDYIDAFLTEREERIRKNDHPEYFDDSTLQADMRILPLVANETTAFLLHWAFLYVMCFPDIQRKIHKEIDNVIGRHRQVSLADKPNMPYMEAFLTELFRRAPLLPLLDPKRVREDTTLEGYFIPKNTLVVGNLWAVHFDEKHFPDPYTFRPERFINAEGKYVKTDRLINFGSGKRNCIAENLGRMTLFLYLTSILQNFTLLPPENEHVSMELGVSLAIVPKAYKLRAIERPIDN